MTNTNNIGVALVDFLKMDEIGSNRVYWLDDFRVVLWQPTWLDMVNEKIRKEKDEELTQ